MRARVWLPGAAAVVTVAALITAFALAGTAAPPTGLYVNDTANCSDTGHGAKSLPFCSLAAATLAARSGQTIHITGPYGRLTVTKSGITFQGVSGKDGSSAKLTGVTIDGVHDVTVSGFTIDGFGSEPSMLVEHSSTITLSDLNIDATTSTAPVTELVDVGHSTLESITATSAPSGAAVILDKNTSYVTLHDYQFSASEGAGIGVEVAGDHDTLSAVESDHAASGIVVDQSADHTIIADSTTTDSAGDGVVVAGSHTALSNDGVSGSCRVGLDVQATAIGTSVENSDLGGNGGVSCPAPSASDHPAADLGVFGAATSSTTVDYNVTWPGPRNAPLYYWNGERPTLVAFQVASGQGAHDIAATIPSTETRSPNYDSANSAAPGFPATDANGQHREDDPSIPNTGAGPIPYADRGPDEYTHGAMMHGQMVIEPSTKTVTVHAIVDRAGWSPVARYTFDFGDGSPLVIQASPVAVHTYAKRASYQIHVGDIAADGNTFRSPSQSVQVQLGTGYHAVTPYRVFTSDRIVPGAAADIGVQQLHDVPPDTVAVLLNITAVGGTADGSASAYWLKATSQDDDDDTQLYAPTFLHWAKGQTVSNLLSMSFGYPFDSIGVVNDSKGKVTFQFDVLGYETYANGSLYEATAPVNVFHPAAPVPAGASVSLPTAGLGLPSGVTSVVLDVTANGQAATGALTVSSGGTPRPAIGNVQWTSHQATTHLVVVPVTGPTIDFYNTSDGPASVSADLIGYYGSTGTQSTFAPDLTDPLAKRGMPASTRIPANGEITVPIANICPAGTTTVVLNLTVTGAQRSGTITAWGDGPEPTTTNLTFRAGETVSNRVILSVVNGQIHFANKSAGTVTILGGLDQYMIG